MRLLDAVEDKHDTVSALATAVVLLNQADAELGTVLKDRIQNDFFLRRIDTSQLIEELTDEVILLSQGHRWRLGLFLSFLFSFFLALLLAFFLLLLFTFVLHDRLSELDVDRNAVVLFEVARNWNLDDRRIEF